MNLTTHRSSLTRSLMLFSLSLLITLSALVNASAFYLGPLEIQVVDVNDSQLPTYHHQGQYYVMGRQNQRYQLRVTNHSSARYELVMTVDGRDVINGSSGTSQNRGYVVDPHQSFSVEGFRKSSSAVAAFRFTHPADSYASRMGTRENTGVLGFAVFAERGASPRPRPYRRPHSHRYGGDLDAYEDRSLLNAPTASSAESSVRRSRRSSSRSTSKGHTSRHRKSELGTKYGETVHSAIEETEFTRASSQPAQRLVVQYDSEKGLLKRGVIKRHKPYRAQAFPHDSRFAPPPPRY